MINIYTLETAGFAPAFHGMRNPKDSWKYSDSETAEDMAFHIGEVDRKLSSRLQEAGPEHCKHLRMIMVWADITAPRYWWTEFDTYRIGVEKVSCSTMHRLMSRPIEEADFAYEEKYGSVLQKIIGFLNEMMIRFHNENDQTKKKRFWRVIIQTLPQSYLQRRTVMMSYAALRNIYRQRKGHKLEEWQWFRTWVEGLPESWLITDEGDEEDDPD